MSYTTSDLLAGILRKSFAPTGQTTFETDDVLLMADEILCDDLVPDIMSVREEFFVFSKDLTITANQGEYDIPARAVGMIVREIKIKKGTTLSDLPRIEPEDVDTTETGSPREFYLKDNKIVLHPTPDRTENTLVVSFYLRPGKHVETSAAGLITAIDTSTNVVTVSSIPATWATGNVFDLIKQDGGQQPRAIDLTSTLVSGSTITLPSLPTGLAVGDYVALAGETPLPYVLPEFRSVLEQGAAAQILSNMNQPGGEKAEAKYKAMRESRIKLLTPRVHGEDRVIMARNWR